MSEPDPLQRFRLKRCVQCGYDLRGTPDAARCPECGLELKNAMIVFSDFLLHAWIFGAVLFALFATVAISEIISNWPLRNPWPALGILPVILVIGYLTYERIPRFGIPRDGSAVSVNDKGITVLFRFSNRTMPWSRIGTIALPDLLESHRSKASARRHSWRLFIALRSARRRRPFAMSAFIATTHEAVALRNELRNRIARHTDPEMNESNNSKNEQSREP